MTIKKKTTSKLGMKGAKPFGYKLQQSRAAVEKAKPRSERPKPVKKNAKKSP
jgi:hypothetical protein